MCSFCLNGGKIGSRIYDAADSVLVSGTSLRMNGLIQECEPFQWNLDFRLLIVKLVCCTLNPTNSK